MRQRRIRRVLGIERWVWAGPSQGDAVALARIPLIRNNPQEELVSWAALPGAEQFVPVFAENLTQRIQHQSSLAGDIQEGVGAGHNARR